MQTAVGVVTGKPRFVDTVFKRVAVDDDFVIMVTLRQGVVLGKISSSY